MATLSTKRGGHILVLQADLGFQPPAHEVRELYGLCLVQPRDEVALTRELLSNAVCGELSATGCGARRQG